MTELESAGSPFNGIAATVPGSIEAEEFDKGVEGVAFSDTTYANQGKVSYEGPLSRSTA